MRKARSIHIENCIVFIVRDYLKKCQRLNTLAYFAAAKVVKKENILQTAGEEIESGPPKIYCKYCSKVFATENELQIHIGTNHPKVQGPML